MMPRSLYRVSFDAAVAAACPIRTCQREHFWPSGVRPWDTVVTDNQNSP